MLQYNFLNRIYYSIYTSFLKVYTLLYINIYIIYSFLEHIHDVFSFPPSDLNYHSHLHVEDCKIVYYQHGS
uniref:Uncharacterized protein n=1 Tax=Arundo donax TaxID=35708 RepID=A0A0A9CSY6_ARUDO